MLPKVELFYMKTVNSYEIGKLVYFFFNMNTMYTKMYTTRVRLKYSRYFLYVLNKYLFVIILKVHVDVILLNLNNIMNMCTL